MSWTAFSPGIPDLFQKACFVDVLIGDGSRFGLFNQSEKGGGGGGGGGGAKPVKGRSCSPLRSLAPELADILTVLIAGFRSDKLFLL